jgi:phosphonate transport system substrate-binding protein
LPHRHTRGYPRNPRPLAQNSNFKSGHESLTNMANQVNPGRGVHGVGKITAIVASAAVILALAGLACGLFPSECPAKLDTSDVVAGTPSSRTTAATAVSPEILQVAIAAMISPEKTRQHYGDLIKLVGRRIGRPVEILQKKTCAQVNDLLERRALDFALVCSGPYTEGNRKFGMEILVVPVAYGKKVYYSYIIARAGGEVAAFDDLRGRRFAFTDPNSNTGCLVPRYMLAVRGETPERFFKSTSYTHSHDNSVRAVAEGVADGAAVDSLTWEYLNATDPIHTSQTRVIERSPPYGIPPIVVHPATDPRLKSALKGVFLNLHTDPEGAALLAQMGIDRFEEGDDAMYDSIRAIQDWLGRQPAAQPLDLNAEPR